MSLVDVDSWETEVWACERLSANIREQLVQRERKPTSKLDNGIQVGLRQFETELRQLKERLLLTKGNTVVEADQRRQQLSALQDQLRQLHAAFSNANALEADRAALLGDSTSTASTSARGITFNDNSLNAVETLKQRQIDIMEEQERGLETLSQTITRQRALASELGQEVENQNGILDNMSSTIHRVEAGVTAETRNIGAINQRDSTMYHWLVIIALFVAIILILFL